MINAMSQETCLNKIKKEERGGGREKEKRKEKGEGDEVVCEHNGKARSRYYVPQYR